MVPVRQGARQRRTCIVPDVIDQEDASPSTDEAPATPEETRALLLKLSGRGYLVLRHVLCQLPNTTKGSRISVLGPMVTERKRRSIVLYLLLLTIWPWLHRQERRYLSLQTWARALTTDKGRLWTASNVSAAFQDLEERGLVTRTRRSHGLEVAPRREDGQDAYTSPGEIPNDRHHTYFILPGEFWTSGLFEELTVPGLAMLLIIAAETSDPAKAEVWISATHAATWYGISARSTTNGLDDLRKHGLLHEHRVAKKAPLSPTGQTIQIHYSLTGPYSTAAREALRNKTAREARHRLNTTKKTSTKKKTKKKTKKRKEAGS